MVRMASAWCIRAAASASLPTKEHILAAHIKNKMRVDAPDESTRNLQSWSKSRIITVLATSILVFSINAGNNSARHASIATESSWLLITNFNLSIRSSWSFFMAWKNSDNFSVPFGLVQARHWQTKKNCDFKYFCTSSSQLCALI